MIEIDQKVVSRALLEERFVCDLQACKGACCVEGDSGAPLEKQELSLLEACYEDVKPYMREEGIAAVEANGTHMVDWDGEYVTPLINGDGACAYVQYDDRGVALCAIEQAYRDGKTDFRKPISCHLYPVRIQKYARFEAVNYHEWDICEPACSCGEKLEVPVYRFVREALIRKYGEEWYGHLEQAAAFAKR